MAGRNLSLVVVTAALVLASAASAQVYHWEDEDGTLHFSNARDRVPGAPPAEVDPAPPAEPTVHREEPIALARALTRIPYSPGAPIIVSARLGETAEPVQLILDTGADRTVVAPRALGRVGISTANASRAMIRGVTGSGQAEVVLVSSVQVGEARVGPLRIVAHDAELGQADGLLGRDFLEQFTVTIDAREQTVTLSPR